MISLKENYKFEVVKPYSTAFNRQINEALLIKNSKSVVMNSKDMYNRYIIPDIVRDDRG